MMFTLGQPPAPVEELVKDYLKKLVVDSPREVGKAISLLQTIPEPDRIEVFKFIAAVNPILASRQIQHTGIEDQSALAEIATDAALRDGVGTSRRIENYGITDPIARARIAWTALAQDWGTLDELFHYKLRDNILRAEVLKPFFDTLTAGTDIEWNFYQLRNFLRRATTVSSLCSSLGIEYPGRDALAPHEGLARVATWLQSRYDGFNDELLSYQHEVQAEEAIYDALAATIVHWRTADVARYGNRARASLAALTGYDSIPSEQMSSNRRRELYGVLITAYHAIGPDLARRVPVDLRDTARALKLLSLAMAIRGLNGQLPTFNSAISTREQFDNAELMYQQSAVDALRERLAIPNSSDNDAMVQLWDFWGGDLTPLTVLAGRYNAKTDWNEALPILSEIAQRCLNGSFYDWRYGRHDNQLAMLDDRALLAWRNNPMRVTHHRAEQVHAADAARVLVEQAATIFDKEILTHLPQASAAMVRDNPLEHTRAASLLDLSDHEFSRVSLEDTMKLLQHVVTARNESNISRAVKRIYNEKERLLKSLDIERKSALSGSLKSLRTLTKKGNLVNGNQYYVVSVITDHPKLFLMLGDLVQAGSCQNYRSGPNADSLPDYAIDGNVKLALSYVVKASVYDRILGQNTEVEFDPATQSLMVRDSVTRLNLGHAVRREVLRIGTVGTHAACLIEQPEAQNHLLADSIQEQQREFITDYLKGCSISLANVRFLGDQRLRFESPQRRRTAMDETRSATKAQSLRSYSCK